MKTLWLCIAVACVALASSSCSPEQEIATRSEATLESLADTTRPPTTDDQLGYSWDGVQERVKGACLNPGAVITTPYNVAILTLDQVLTSQQASSVLGYSAEGKAKFGLLSAEGKAKFSRSLASNQFSISSYFGYDLLTQRQSIDLRVEPSWLVSADDPDWHLKCGDQYLQEKTFGGQLFVLYRIDFATQSDKQEFAASVGASWNASAKTANYEVSKVSSLFAKRASIHVEALQVGGDATQLATILGGTATGDAGGGRVVLDCTMENLAPCGTFMQNAVNYASGAFAEAVKRQPQFRDETFRDWDAFRVVTHPSRTIPQPLFAARLDLLALLDSQLAFSERVASLQSGKFWVPPGLAGNLPTYAAQAARNLAILSSRSRVCWDEIANPNDPTQANACVTSIQLASLLPDGFTSGLVLDVLETAPAIRYGVNQARYKNPMTNMPWFGGGVWLEPAPEGIVTGKIDPKPYVIQALFVTKTDHLPIASRVCYQLRVAGGWTTEQCDGAIAGAPPATGKASKLVDQLRVRLYDASGVRICYRTYARGWSLPVCDGATSGVSSSPIEAIQLYTVR